MLDVFVMSSFRTVKSAEPLGDEFKKLVGVLTVDMMQNSIVQVMKLIQDLDEVPKTSATEAEIGLKWPVGSAHRHLRP